MEKLDRRGWVSGYADYLQQKPSRTAATITSARSKVSLLPSLCICRVWGRNDERVLGQRIKEGINDSVERALDGPALRYGCDEAKPCTTVNPDY